MTVAEAATRLGLTRGRIRQLLGSGELKGDKKAPEVSLIGYALEPMWFVPEEEIARYKALKESGEVKAGRKKVERPSKPAGKPGRPRKQPAD